MRLIGLELASEYIKLKRPQISNQIYQNPVRICIRSMLEMSSRSNIKHVKLIEDRYLLFGDEYQIYFIEFVANINNFESS